jgi:aerobic carbon-monoxide dehydrogenase large subunit
MSADLARHKTDSFYRLEDAPLLRGKGQFIDDIKVSNVFDVAFVRSQQGHARILRIDADEARRMPGVRAVLTYGDLRRC